ncbi:type II secretion system protein [Pseudocolwellia sp. AS88]|jgi:MSHA pilin protein MshC|uniref:type II secretion system protein n=1 Tax=Pseudocolwellia sp. AS88 TaxID=3063958 RepID=UPI0026EF6507|nr:type II secretion system protein [Pseudocolwellia sp. AS88]MDO7084313.1 type II secretion system protein [Pseudocolwellia sp. AS88]
MSKPNNISLHSQLNCKTFVGLKKQTTKGFTIIELVLVIVLMGILAVSVAPKMFNSGGFEEYAYQAELVATLRNIQLRAMQQTENYVNNYGDGCHTVVVTSNKVTVSSSCNINTGNLDVPTVEIDNAHSLSFSPAMSFTFDSMGKPSSCNNPCQIQLVANDNLSVVIESEGFIHAQ